MKNTVATFQKMKNEGTKISMLTAYDYSTAKLVDAAGINSILVGDSLGMVMLGYEDTLSVTMEDMIHHTAAVARGAKDALVIGDMPFMSYEVSVEQAVTNAGRLMKEGRANAVKLEGGVRVAEQIKAITKAGIPVCAHIGLTPTMGALHEGHMSLMERARKECDRVVTSVFVNPIQFGPNEDYDNYPRDLEHDAAIAESKGVDVVFHPEPEEMYPKNYNTYVVMETLTDSLCGAKRPGHFRGVCTVVNKLFNIVQPDKAFFGQKDAQQLAIIKRMVADLNMNVKVYGCPIVREEDGLAKSSRNSYLSAEERKAALCLSRSIFKAQELIEGGERDANKVRAAVREVIEAEPLAKIDYVEVVDLGDMQPVDSFGESGLVAIAVYIGKTRLIDNYLFDFDE